MDSESQWVEDHMFSDEDVPSDQELASASAPKASQLQAII